MRATPSKTFIQVLEGTTFQDAQVVALIDAPLVVQVVRQALATFFARPFTNTNGGSAPKNGKPTSYMQKYGKTLTRMAKEAGLPPTVVSTRLRRGWALKTALRTPARPRRAAKPKAAP